MNLLKFVFLKYSIDLTKARVYSVFKIRYCDKATMNNPLNIVLMVTADYAVGRGIIRGAARQAFPIRPWCFHPRFPHQDDVAILKQLKPEAVIAQVHSAKLAQCLHAWGGPVVNVSAVSGWHEFPTVTFDNYAIGRMAAEELIALGHRHFGFVGESKRQTSVMRHAGFSQTLEKQGFACHSLLLNNPPLLLPSEAWKSAEHEMRPWLKQLPKPLAVFAFNDIQAADVSRSCRVLQLRVPEDVCIIGVDNDPLFSELSYPPISSIELPCEKVGEQAVLWVDELLAGKELPSQPLLLPPLAVERRQSTELTFIGDPVIAKAIRFIRDHLSTASGVETVARAAGVNRRSLERKFKAHFGHGPARELMIQKVIRAKTFLRDTESSVESIALQCGFSEAARLYEAFRLVTGESPGAYRRRCR